LEEIGLPLGGGSEPNYGRFPADPTLSEALLAACERATGTKAVSGTFLTVSRITSSLAESERLTRCLGRVLCESMEGAAAAQVAHHYGLPFGELRAVSNQIEDRERQRWDFEAAAISCARALGAFLGGPR
jgi:futalosine hydrolase